MPRILLQICTWAFVSETGVLYVPLLGKVEDRWSLGMFNTVSCAQLDLSLCGFTLILDCNRLLLTIDNFDPKYVGFPLLHCSRVFLIAYLLHPHDDSLQPPLNRDVVGSSYWLSDCVSPRHAGLPELVTSGRLDTSVSLAKTSSDNTLEIGAPFHSSVIVCSHSCSKYPQSFQKSFAVSIFALLRVPGSLTPRHSEDCIGWGANSSWCLKSGFSWIWYVPNGVSPSQLAFPLLLFDCVVQLISYQKRIT